MRPLRVLAVAVVVMVCAVSCDFNDALFTGVERNPFLENVYDFPVTSADEEQSFVVVTDVHIGRESRDSGILRYDDSFSSFLKANIGHYSALVSLGDFVDESKSPENRELAFVRSFAPYCSNRFIGVVGNHETHGSSMKSWEDSLKAVREVDVFMKRMAVYRFGEVSLYVMDNAKRLFGYEQLRSLEEALKADRNPVKIVLAHENVFTGRKADQSLVVFGNGSATEMAAFSKILGENGASLVLTGHTHNGGVVYDCGNGCREMNLAAYHGRKSPLEGSGNWYVVSIDKPSREVSVVTYDAATAKAVAENRFGY